MPMLLDATITDAADALLLDAAASTLLDQLMEVDVATLTDVWEALQRLAADLPEAAIAIGVKAYPGLAGVDLGVETEFSGPIDVTATMQGVLVTIQDAGGRLGKRELPTLQTVYAHAGFLTFGDGTDWEGLQGLNVDARVYTPRAFANPTHVAIVPNAGVTGTVQPWTVKIE